VSARLRFPIRVGETVGVDVRARTPQVEHEREPDADLGGGDHHDEQREALPGVDAVHEVGGHQNQVDAAEHEFSGGELQDGVASGEDAVESDREQPHGDDVPDHWMHGASNTRGRSVVRGHMASSWPTEKSKVQC